MGPLWGSRPRAVQDVEHLGREGRDLVGGIVDPGKAGSSELSDGQQVAQIAEKHLREREDATVLQGTVYLLDIDAFGLQRAVTHGNAPQQWRTVGRASRAPA